MQDNNKKAISPKKALNKAFLKVKPSRDLIEGFKTNLIDLLDKIDESESEEFHKNLITDFLKTTYYRDKHFINTKDRKDLVIYNGKNAQSNAGVIIEVKSPVNTSEMLKKNKLNTKAFQELLLYYLRERITGKNTEIKHLIATNIYEWFIFDAHIFEKAFAQNKKLVAIFIDFEAGRLSGNTTDFFYREIATPAIEKAKEALSFTWFDIREYEKPLRNVDKKDDKQLVALYKTFSPEHLLKLPFTNDSNSLDQKFYTELLHIIGLGEIKQKGKKLIERNPEGQRNNASLLENAINILDSRDKISQLKHPSHFGENKQARLFNVALESVITWINRILFLKLLEAQQINYHKGDKSYAFLNIEMVKNFDDLDSLFFSVLACRPEERDGEVKELFSKVPYLNSSLFEPTGIEHATIFISNLRDERKLPILSSSVLKDGKGKKRSGELSTLEYLFEFLNAYDFSSEGSEEIQEENKTLINASVLGLVFEKINGYKDGSFFTPGFITMYMCHETITGAVLQKFNEAKCWNCKDMDQLYENIEDKKEANEIINSLKICDPAVGSGHFLVSALNEIIAIKSSLKILLDRQGKTLRDYDIEVVNDELVITDDNGDPFEYNPNSKESQRIQETLFHEKQTIIENCLFGVDINHNSIKICRLRLWIELLKNTYYKSDGQLETLPNIDINIKCGNSLISRYALDTDIKKTLKKSKFSIKSYRTAVMAYRNAENKEQKRAMERLIDQIKNDFETEIDHTDKRNIKLVKFKNELNTLMHQADFFAIPKAEKTAKQKRRHKLIADIEKLEKEIKEITNNKIYENAFEWRFEFPEVLNDQGEFIGFDLIIGNPPYVQLQKDGGGLADTFGDCGYETFERTGDIFCLFYERGYQILRNNGVLIFITSNKWMRANYGKTMREYFIKHGNITQLIDFGDAQFFENATTYTNILLWEKNKQQTKTQAQAWDLSHVGADNTPLGKLLEQQEKCEPLFNESSFVITKPAQAVIKRKIEKAGVPLENWDIAISRGILTGLNEAFIINEKTRNELIAQDPKSTEIIKPILRGRDIKKYKAEWAGLWLINAYNGYGNVSRIDVPKDYPAIWQYLRNFNDKHNGAIEKRGDRGTHWSNLRNCAYVDDFAKEKVIWLEMSPHPNFLYDTTQSFVLNTAYILTGENLKYLLAVLNSSVLNYYFPMIATDIRGKTRRYIKQYVKNLPIPQIPIDSQRQFEMLVDKISFKKQSNPAADTSEFEEMIDSLVYDLYGLSEEEIAIVEGC